MSAARYVGRVGGLAVALGVGSLIVVGGVAAILNDDPGQAPAATSAKTNPASHPCIRS